MKEIAFHYGSGHLTHAFKEEELAAVLESSINNYDPGAGEVELVERAMENPIGSASLQELAKGKNKVVIIASDHTRPVPSRDILPNMLSELYEGNPGIKVTLLVATGFHRPTTSAELCDKLGDTSRGCFAL